MQGQMAKVNSEAGRSVQTAKTAPNNPHDVAGEQGPRTLAPLSANNRRRAGHGPRVKRAASRRSRSLLKVSQGKWMAKD